MAAAGGRDRGAAFSNPRPQAAARDRGTFNSLLGEHATASGGQGRGFEPLATFNVPGQPQQASRSSNASPPLSRGSRPTPDCSPRAVYVRRWARHRDAASGAAYYEHTPTGQTQWERPASFASASDGYGSAPVDGGDAGSGGLRFADSTTESSGDVDGASEAEAGFLAAAAGDERRSAGEAMGLGGLVFADSDDSDETDDEEHAFLEDLAGGDWEVPALGTTPSPARPAAAVPLPAAGGGGVGGGGGVADTSSEEAAFFARFATPPQPGRATAAPTAGDDDTSSAEEDFLASLAQPSDGGRPTTTSAGAHPAPAAPAAAQPTTIRAPASVRNLGGAPAPSAGRPNPTPSALLGGRGPADPQVAHTGLLGGGASKPKALDLLTGAPQQGQAMGAGAASLLRGGRAQAGGPVALQPRRGSAGFGPGERPSLLGGAKPTGPAGTAGVLRQPQALNLLAGGAPPTAGRRPMTAGRAGRPVRTYSGKLPQATPPPAEAPTSVDEPGSPAGLLGPRRGTVPQDEEQQGGDGTRATAMEQQLAALKEELEAAHAAKAAEQQKHAAEKAALQEAHAKQLQEEKAAEAQREAALQQRLDAEKAALAREKDEELRAHRLRDDAEKAALARQLEEEKAAELRAQRERDVAEKAALAQRLREEKAAALEAERRRDEELRAELQQRLDAQLAREREVHREAMAEELQAQNARQRAEERQALEEQVARQSAEREELAEQLAAQHSQAREGERLRGDMHARHEAEKVALQARLEEQRAADARQQEALKEKLREQLVANEQQAQAKAQQQHETDALKRQLEDRERELQRMQTELKRQQQQQRPTAARADTPGNNKLGARIMGLFGRKENAAEQTPLMERAQTSPRSDSSGSGMGRADTAPTPVRLEEEDDELIRSVKDCDIGDGVGVGGIEAVAPQQVALDAPAAELDEVAARDALLSALACTERDETKCRIEYEEAEWMLRKDIEKLRTTARTNAHRRDVDGENAAYPPGWGGVKVQVDARYEASREERRKEAQAQWCENAAKHPLARLQAQQDAAVARATAHEKPSGRREGSSTVAPLSDAEYQRIKQRVEGGQTVPRTDTLRLRQHVRWLLRDELARIHAAAGAMADAPRSTRHKHARELVEKHMPRAKVAPLPKLPAVYRVLKQGGTTGSSWQQKWCEVGRDSICLAEDETLSSNRKVIPVSEVRQVATVPDAELGRPNCVRVEVVGQKDKLLQAASAAERAQLVRVLAQVKTAYRQQGDTFDIDAIKGEYWKDLPGEFMYKPPTKYDGRMLKGLTQGVRSDKWTPRWVWSAKGCLCYARKKGDPPEKTITITTIRSVYALEADELEREGVPKHMRGKAFQLEVEDRKILLATETRASRDKWIAFIEDSLFNTSPHGVSVSRGSSPKRAPQQPRPEDLKQFAEDAYERWKEGDETMAAIDLEEIVCPFEAEGAMVWPTPRTAAATNAVRDSQVFRHTFTVGHDGDLGIVIDPKELRIAGFTDVMRGKEKTIRLGTRILEVEGIQCSNTREYEACLKKRGAGGKRKFRYDMLLQGPPVHVEYFDSASTHTVLSMPVGVAMRAPEPMPPYLEATPEEMRQKIRTLAAKRRDDRLNEVREAQKEIKESIAPTDAIHVKAAGMMKSSAQEARARVRNAMSEAKHKAKQTFANTISHGATARFKKRFPELTTEAFICNYKCIMQFARGGEDAESVRHQDTHLMVTKEHVAYYDGGKSKETFRGWIPLANVVSIQLATTQRGFVVDDTNNEEGGAQLASSVASTSTASPAQSPATSPRSGPASWIACKTVDWVMEDTDLADSIQVFTKDNRRYDFMQVRPISLEKKVTPKDVTAINGLLSYLDGAWRDASEAAITDYTYAEEYDYGASGGRLSPAPGAVA